MAEFRQECLGSYVEAVRLDALAGGASSLGRRRQRGRRSCARPLAHVDQRGIPRLVGLKNDGDARAGLVHDPEKHLQGPVEQDTSAHDRFCRLTCEE
jgi:hypothetical protein